jgi:hypothetical protein
MKMIKFSEPLPQLILDGKKWTTWRIGDEKNIAVGDEISLCDGKETEFAKAKVLWTREKEFGRLTKEDREGHEPFSSDSEMYETYSRYYRIIVTPKTRVKVVKFKLL